MIKISFLKQLFLASCLLFLALCPLIFLRAYDGYLATYLLFFILFYKSIFEVIKIKPSFINSVGCVWVVIIIIQTIYHNSFFTIDSWRDIGCFISFLLGRFLIPYLFKNEGIKGLFDALSLTAFNVAVAVFVGAFLALKGGASAYEFRGQYIIMAASWLIYFYVIVNSNYFIDKKFHYLSLMIIAAILVSLSRTDILILILLLIVINYKKIKEKNIILKVLLYSPIFAIFLTAFMGLDVVQERISLGVGDEDDSLGWRLTENETFFSYFFDGSIFQQFFGFGLGARLPLPYGVVDFDGNPDIPLLHNSYLTWTLKFGYIGWLLALLFFIRYVKNFLIVYKSIYSNYALTGALILFSILLKAVTLQALTEWSHVIFFGLGIYLISPSTYKNISIH